MKKIVMIGIVVILIIVSSVIYFFNTDNSNKKTEILNLLENLEIPDEYEVVYSSLGGKHVHITTKVTMKIKNEEIVFLDGYYHSSAGTGKPYSQEAYHLYDLKEEKDEFSWKIIEIHNRGEQNISEINETVKVWAENKKAIHFDSGFVISKFSEALRNPISVGAFSISFQENWVKVVNEDNCFESFSSVSTLSSSRNKICFRENVLYSYNINGVFSDFNWQVIEYSE